MTVTLASSTYTFDDLRRFHDEFTLRTWIEPGEMMRYAFLNTPEFLPHALIHRDGPIAVLEDTPREDVGATRVRTPLGEMTIDAYIDQADSTGTNAVIVVHRGAVIYERYPRMRRIDSHLLMSVSKVFAGTLIGILEDRGQVNANDAVDTYLPELRESGWSGVALRDVLDMTSGIDCDELAPEAYHDPSSTYYPFEESLGLIPTYPESRYSTWEYVATLRQAKAPGQAYDYTSVNTFVLGWIAERAIGRRYTDLVTDEIWAKIGAEADALISSSRCGAVAHHGGFVCRLRDLARFGLLFTPSWRTVSAMPLISDRHVAAITRVSRPEIFDRGAYGRRDLESLAPARPTHNARQWDFVMPNGDFFKGGFGGQGLYISPANDLVIAFFGTMARERREHALKSIAQQLSETWSG